MNDKELDLIKQVLQAAGTAGEKGFEYLVRYYLIDGILGFIGWGLAMCGAVWLIQRAFRWEPEEDEAHIMRAVTIVVLSLAMFGFLCGMMSGLSQALAPEGAAIHGVLRR